MARCHTGMAETYLMGSKGNLRDLQTCFKNSQFICLCVENSLQPLHSPLSQIHCAITPLLTMLPAFQTGLDPACLPFLTLLHETSPAPDMHCKDLVASVLCVELQW